MYYITCPLSINAKTMSYGCLFDNIWNLKVICSELHIDWHQGRAGHARQAVVGHHDPKLFSCSHKLYPPILPTSLFHYPTHSAQGPWFWVNWWNLGLKIQACKLSFVKVHLRQGTSTIIAHMHSNIILYQKRPAIFREHKSKRETYLKCSTLTP